MVLVRVVFRGSNKKQKSTRLQGGGDELPEPEAHLPAPAHPQHRPRHIKHQVQQELQVLQALRIRVFWTDPDSDVAFLKGSAPDPHIV